MGKQLNRQAELLCYWETFVEYTSLCIILLAFTP